MSRIFIIGSGTVGSATGLDLIQAGHQVTFVDDDRSRVTELTAQGFDARPAVGLDGEPEAFIFLCLPTPSDGQGYDLTAIQAGAVQIGLSLASADARHIVVVRSTVPPGTTRELVRPLLERYSGKRDGVGFGLAASPDFRRTSRPVPGLVDQGRTEHGLPIRGLFEERQGFAGPRMTVIGARSQRVAHRLGDLLGPLGGQVRVFDDPATAELIKCTSSLFNATKISFWNEIWGVCDQLGLDADQIADTVASSAQGSTDPGYGLRGGAPYGGAQLPGDTDGFLGFAAELGIPMPLLSAVVGVNTAFERRLAAEFDGISAISAIPRSRTELPAGALTEDRPAGNDRFGDGRGSDDPADGGLVVDGLVVDGLAGDGLVIDGLTGDDLVGDEPAGDGLVIDGPVGDGRAGSDRLEDGLAVDGLIGDDLMGDDLVGAGRMGDGLTGGASIGESLADEALTGARLFGLRIPRQLRR